MKNIIIAAMLAACGASLASGAEFGAYIVKIEGKKLTFVKAKVKKGETKKEETCQVIEDFGVGFFRLGQAKYIDNRPTNEQLPKGTVTDWNQILDAFEKTIKPNGKSSGMTVLLVTDDKNGTITEIWRPDGRPPPRTPTKKGKVAP